MAKDPYRYFRIEAQELVQGLAEGLLELDAGGDAEVVKRLLRFAHTFKGAARVVKRADIGDLAHRIEDELSPHRDAGGQVPRASVDEMLSLVDRIRTLVASLDAETPAEPAKPARAATLSEHGPAVRIAIGELDTLLESVAEAHSATSSLRRSAEELVDVCTRARALLLVRDQGLAGGLPMLEAERTAAELARAEQAIVERLERVTGEVDELRVLASELRLVPAESLLGDLEQAAREATRSLDKEVEIVSRGADTYIDAHVLAGLRPALLHVVRNSIAHGIEDRGTRLRAGKSAVGRIEITIARRGHRVAIQCRDDGRGLDLESVRQEAIDRRLVDREAAAAMDESALARLLLAGGLSTTRVVNDLSGRGVGLDAVRHAVEALEGEVALRSEPGIGVTVELLVPISLSAMPALPLCIDDAEVLVPLDSVRKAVRVSGESIARDVDGERLVVDGVVVPFVSLQQLLDRGRSDRVGMQTAVVVEAEGRLAAIGVDRLGGTRSIVVRAIPAHAAARALVSGATFDDDGRPQLVLAPTVLVREATLARPVARMAEARTIPPILVVDDSLTTRMLEQSILESAGFEVDLAVSGEQALEKARQRHYGVFVVDVEMPGMTGFEFIAATRDDPVLRRTPAILVTSRNDPEDKRRGMEVGARAYIVKSEFDQAVLLETVRRLVG
jgi:two-component system chemotaxis sensor kinase CheA